MLHLLIDREFNDFSLHGSLCPTLQKLRDLPDTQNIHINVDNMGENLVNIINHPSLSFSPDNKRFTRMIVYIDLIDESYNQCLAETVVCFIKVQYMGYTKLPSLHC